MDIKNVRNKVVNAVAEKSPEILIGFGLAGMLTSTVMAVKATPKALDILEREDRELSKVDKVKLTWKCYAPAALGYCVSAACIIGANSVNSKRNAVLAGAYKLSESALLEYRDKVVEVLGEEKEKEIREQVAGGKIADKPADVMIVGKGDTLCYDVISGRYFRSTMADMQAVKNQLSYRLMNENIVRLNEFYMDLGLSPTNIGDDMGWNIDDGLIELSFSAMVTDDGQPCLVMHFDNMPRHDFDRIG